MYKRYKDDVNFVVEAKEDNSEVEEVERQRRIATRVKDIAEEVDENLKVTVDATFEHEDGRLPLLEVKIWIGKTKQGETKILHTHYMKGVSTRALINAESAHGESMKVNVMVNEVVRILKNCSVHLEWEVMVKWVAHFVKRLQFSGYDQKFRYLVVNKALARYDKRIEECQRTGTMFPTISEEEKEKRRREKKEWYTRGGRYESVMFVEATPNGELRKKIQNLANKYKVKMRVVERVSSTIKREIQRSDPFGDGGCGRKDCEVCRGGNTKDCRTSGCVYELICKECDRRYRGTTSRTLYHRTKEEVADWRKKDDESPLWKHARLYHDGKEFEIDIKVIGRCFGKPTRRRITEAVMIEELSDDKTMNSKGEWSYIRLSKVGMT